MNLLQSRYDLMVRMLSAPPVTAETVYLEEQKKTLGRILNGERYLVATFYVPNEILALFDMPVLYIERTAGFAVSCGAADKITEKDSSGRGIPLPDSACSYQRLFLRLLEKGVLPQPAGIAASSFACDDAFLFCAAAAKRYEIPFYWIDIAKSSLRDCAAEQAHALHHFAAELKRNFRQVRPIEETMAKSDEALCVKNNIDTLRLSYPGLLDSRDCLKLFPVYNDLGRDCAVKALSLMESDALRKAAAFKRTFCKKIYWCGLVPLYRNRLLTDIEQRYSCRIVFEELFDFGKAARGDPYESIAKRLASGIYFSPENRKKRIRSQCKKAGVDGIICVTQRNCKFLDSLLMPALYDFYEGGIPFVELSCDVMDKRYFDENRVWNILDAFFELEAFQ